jgi:transposase InsO family protein
MSLRRLIVEVDVEGLNVREFCALHGCSTWFFYDLRRRFQTDGDAALEPKSRAPHRVWNKTRVEVEDAVIRVRKDLEERGLDHGADEVVAALVGRVAPVPSRATAYRILKARGFIVAEPRKAPKRAVRRFTVARANECWQLDDTGWELADGTEVKILNVLDDHSRLLVASTAIPGCTGEVVLAAVATAASTLGWPTRFLSDNAGPFRHVLADALRPVGVAAGHSRPYHPQTNGKVERFHQTVKRWLRAQPAAQDLDELQAQLDCYRHHYNHHRRHRGIDRRVPGEVWAAAPKAGPADRPLQPPSTVRHGTVANGTVTIAGYTISLGAAHNGQRTLAVITGLDCHVFIDGRLARQLTLDPNRRVQPLHPRPGRPTVRDVPRQP